MLSTFASMMILATLAATASEGRHIDAVEVYSCNFSEDVNYDRWPDNWQRERGPNWPFYVAIGLKEDPRAVAGKCLTIDLNGGSAAVSSPRIPVSDKFDYVVEAKLRATGMKHSTAQLRVDFIDDSGTVLESIPVAWLKNTEGWIKVDIDPVSIHHSEVHFAVIRLIVERGEHVDLKGEVALDDVWFARMPRMMVHTNSSFNVYTDPHDVVITCELSGVLESDPDIVFKLLDASDHEINTQSLRLDGRLITERVSKASAIVDTSHKQVKGYEGSTQWRLPIDDFGFYRVRVEMQTLRGTLKKSIISIAVVPPLEEKIHGEFGWSLAGDELPLTYKQLEDLLPRVALSWVKLPVWYGQSEPELGEQLVVLSERLATKDIEIVGVIDRPPQDIDLGRNTDGDVTIADLLSADSDASWHQSLDAMLTRLSLRVRWWQLGVDHDTSFSDFHDLESEIAKLREQLFRFGQDVKLGIGWPWHEESPTDKLATWDFQQFSATPALTGEEIAAYLSLPKRAGVARWAMIEPLKKDYYDLETRTRDLVQQLLAAKINGADGIFAARPFDDQRGLMTDKGTPGELLLPWRTTASLLSGTEYLGQIQLPHRSDNHLFETPDGKVVMVIWNQNPIEEVLYLGENIRIVDIWGRSTQPAKREHRQVLRVHSLPQFIVGLSPEVAKWRIHAHLAQQHIPSVLGQEHPNHLAMINSFKQGAGGSVQLITPEDWQVTPKKLAFKLSAGEQTRRPFEIALPFDVNSGEATIRADFTFTADRPYRFSIYRDIRVGNQDIEIELQTHLDKKGMLVVEQRMINHGGGFADFKCMLYAKQRQTQSLQVFRLGNSHDRQKYYFPNGEQLLDTQLWLRVEELDGTRVFNHRITVEQ